MGILDKFERYAEKISELVSVMDDNYDGGEFCKGLTIGHLARNIG